MNRKKVVRYIFIASFFLVLIIPQFFLEYNSRFYFIDDLQMLLHAQIVNVRETFNIISDLKNVGRQNKILEQEVSELKVRLLMNDAIKKENEECSACAPQIPALFILLFESFGLFTLSQSMPP